MMCCTADSEDDETGAAVPSPRGVRRPVVPQRKRKVAASQVAAVGKDGRGGSGSNVGGGGGQAQALAQEYGADMEDEYIY